MIIRSHVKSYASTTASLWNLDPCTARHFDDDAETSKAPSHGTLAAETLLQNRAAVRSTRKREEDLNIVEGEHLNYC